MSKTDDDHRQSLALLRHGVMADLIHLPLGSPGITEQLRAKASRNYVIPYAAFAFAENTVAFLPVFKQALIRRGLPERLYVDNGATDPPRI